MRRDRGQNAPEMAGVGKNKNNAAGFAKRQCRHILALAKKTAWGLKLAAGIGKSKNKNRRVQDGAGAKCRALAGIGKNKTI